MLLLIIVVAVLLVPVLITLPIKLIALSVGMIMAGRSAREGAERSKIADDALCDPGAEGEISTLTDRKQDDPQC